MGETKYSNIVFRMTDVSRSTDYDYSLLDRDPSLSHGYLINLGPVAMNFTHYKRQWHIIHDRIKIKSEFRERATEHFAELKEQFAREQNVYGNYSNKNI